MVLRQENTDADVLVAKYRAYLFMLGRYRTKSETRRWRYLDCCEWQENQLDLTNMAVHTQLNSLFRPDPQVHAHVSVSSNSVVPRVKPVLDPLNRHARIFSNSAQAGNKVNTLPEDNALTAHVYQQRDVLLKKFDCKSICVPNCTNKWSKSDCCSHIMSHPSVGSDELLNRACYCLDLCVANCIRVLIHLFSPWPC